MPPIEETHPVVLRMRLKQFCTGYTGTYFQLVTDDWLERRPPTYWKLDDLLQEALVKIKGEWRRHNVARMAMLGIRLEEIPRFFLQQGVTAAELMNGLHRFGSRVVLGEHLLDVQPGEVEIGRVCWEIPALDGVTSIRARPVDGGIGYTVIDDCDGLYRFEPAWTKEPLTLGELARVVETATGPDGEPLVGLARRYWHHLRGLGKTRDETWSGVRVHSIFYPDLMATSMEAFDRFWPLPSQAAEPAGAVEPGRPN